MEDLLTHGDQEGLLLYEVINWAMFGGGLIVAALLLRYPRLNPPSRQELTDEITRRSWTTSQVGILLAALFLLYFLASFVGLSFCEEQLPLVQLITTIIIYTIIVAIIIVIHYKRDGMRTERDEMGLRQIKKLLLSPVLYLAFIPFLMLISKAYHLLLKYFGMEVELQAITQVVTQEFSWMKILYLIMMIVVSPISEELIFRGIVFPYLVRRTGLVGGTVLVSLLFAMMHFHLPSFVPLFLFSSALCLAYWRTGSLWVNIGMHTIFNTVTILALNIVN